MLVYTKFDLGQKVFVLRTFKPMLDCYEQDNKKCIFVSYETLKGIKYSLDCEGKQIPLYYTDGSTEPVAEEYIFTNEHSLAGYISKILKEDDSNE